MSVADHDIGGALDELVSGREIVPGLLSATTLAAAAARADDPAATLQRIAELVDQDDDQLAAIAGVHAMSAVPGPLATSRLTDLLDDPRVYIGEHAAWALSARPPHRRAMAGLAGIVVDGGFRGMLAQRTLRGWATGDPVAVAAAVASKLDRSSPGGRAKLVETLGLVPDRIADPQLVQIAADPTEAFEARRAAVAALGDGRLAPAAVELLHRLARGDDELSIHALLALLDGFDLPHAGATTEGLRIAQVYLYADLESGLEHAGAGDHGGISTLLSILAETMSQRPDVAEVRSISRGSTRDAVAGAWTTDGTPNRFEAVPFGGGESVDARGAWSYRIEIERGVRRALRAGNPPHVVHLRLADVGTLATDAVARRLGIPVVFTAAPDPHAVLETIDGTTLSRTDFGDSDGREHWWFRARMVEQLTMRSDRIALLPRVGLTAEIRRLLGVDVDVPAGHSVVIPEGVHAATVRRAAADVERVTAHGGTSTPDELANHGAGLSALVRAVAAMPDDRHGRPLVITVGRLHPLKGVDRVVRAWMSSDLSSLTNLVVVGGDLENPSADELDVLATIDDVVAGPPAAAGVVMLGHRPHADVARILAAAASGFAPYVGSPGVYVCGALKEEFGLAIVEALAAGLAVVAPQRGGPATYVSDGRNGRLVDTTSVEAIGAGMVDAFDLSQDRPMMRAAADEVLDHLTIESMAARLVALYASVATVPHGAHA